MPGPGESLFWITLCAVLAPLLAGIALRGRVPEVVLLLGLGVVIGPNALDLAATGEGVAMLRELGPIVAMAVLLGARGAVESVLVLAGFALLAVVVHRFSARLGRTPLLTAVRRGAETSGQTQVRLVVLLLVTLTVAAAAFELDAVLGAFAAGFVLRQLVPEGHESLEHKLEGLAFGLLIPVFFVTSGMAIDPRAVVEEPVALVCFVALILVVRGGIVYVTARRGDGFDGRDSATIALFSSTGLPIIVAVTSVAVGSGDMSTTSASVLVAGGAITVLVCPLLAQRLLARSAPGVTRFG